MTLANHHQRLVIDIETRSAADLKKVGPVVYAADPTTSITHVGWRNGGPAHVWQPAREPAPNELLDALTDPRVALIAHNVGFERHLLSGPPGRALGLSEALSDLERWSDTSARAACLGLPHRLEHVCRALKLPVEKDAKGHKLMLRVSKPRKPDPLVWWDGPEDMQRMAEYCAADVIAEAHLDQMVPELPPLEREIWLLTERMNDRGILVDRILLEQLIHLAETAKHDLNNQIHAATRGAVPKVSNHPALTRWLNAQGVETDSVRRDVVEELLTRDDLDPLVRHVLELREEGGGSSNTKTGSIARRLSANGRIRDALIYCGASSTGRWSSHGAQLQNLKRPDPKLSAPAILRDLRAGATCDELAQIHGPPLKLVSELLRPLFIASPGVQLVTADFSQIEARVLSWAAGQDDKLDVFRRFDAGGTDPYKITASRIFPVPIEQLDPTQRQIGKVADLALGYQGGVKALKKMARAYGLRIPDPEAEQVKLAWRAAHPFIVHFWWALEAAARECVLARPGQIFRVRCVEFKRAQRAMTLRLPSNRTLVYWDPSLKEVKTPWDELRNQVHYWSQNTTTRRWEQFVAYGGLFTENLVQAISRDLMADALLRLDQAGFHPVLTIHDEAVCEANAPVSAVKEIMETAPPWASGLPLAAKVTAGSRYEKG